MPAELPSPQDWSEAAELVAESGRTTTVTALGELVATRLERLLGGEFVTWDHFGEAGAPLAYRTSRHLGSRDAPLREAFVAYFPEHPFAGDVLPLARAGRVLQLSDRVSDRAFRQTGLWNEVYIHLRARRQLAFGGAVDVQSTWLVGVNRLGRDFGRRERQLARYLQPRLATAFAAAGRRERASRLADTLVHGFTSPGAAFVVLDAAGRIVESSAAARRLLAVGSAGPAGGGETLPPATLQELRRLAHGPAPAPTASGEPPSPWRVATVAGCPALVLAANERGGMIVLLQPPPAATAPAPAGPAAGALSPRETEVLRWLGEGKSNAEIAGVLGISPRTVETHCQRVYEKLGVENRLGAALLARGHGSRPPD